MIDATILNKRVLIVDDMGAIREALLGVLKTIGFTDITQAVDGLDAWDKALGKLAAGSPFELIFSDINMPKCNGINFLKLVRENANYKSVPVLMVTSENELNIILDAVQAGANSYILKPFNKVTIEQKITEVFTKKAAAKK